MKTEEIPNEVKRFLSRLWNGERFTSPTYTVSRITMDTAEKLGLTMWDARIGWTLTGKGARIASPGAGE